MKKIIPIVIITLLCVFATKAELNSKTEVLVVTSGHNRFDTDEFFNMIFALSDIKVDTISQPRANEMLLSDSIQKYNTILFFDMWQKITEDQKNAFIDLTKAGVGLVFLHHSLVSYQQWDEFTNIIGGKYYHDRYDYPRDKFSTYKHDVSLQIEIINPNHPITNGINNFTVIEEAYNNIKILDHVTPILITKHPDCVETIGWTHSYHQSKVVYILPGHGSQIYSHPEFRQLLSNAIRYTIKD